MNATVVCISRTVAAGGAYIGRLVAQRLGYRYFDEEIITLAGQNAGIDPQLLAEVEHHETLVARLREVLAAVATFPATHSDVPAVDVEESAASALRHAPGREERRRLIREVITQIGHQGDAVIVAHAASIPLAGTKGVLRVMVTASEAVRARRLEMDVRIINERETLQTVHESDRARLDYLRDFYGVTEETPLLYDLVINTDRVSHATAAGIIVAAARGLT